MGIQGDMGPNGTDGETGPIGARGNVVCIPCMTSHCNDPCACYYFDVCRDPVDLLVLMDLLGKMGPMALMLVCKSCSYYNRILTGVYKVCMCACVFIEGGDVLGAQKAVLLVFRILTPCMLIKRVFHIHDSKTRHVRIFQGSPGPRGLPGEKGIQGLSGFKGNQVRKIPIIHDFLGSSEIYILLRQAI